MWQVFSISSSVGVPAIFVRTRLNSPLSSLSDTVLVRHASITAFLPLPREALAVHEFAFIVDCSGSMGGSRIEQARLCLNLLIRPSDRCVSLSV
jgi:hypothetical protein